jgi:hypothetical protein
LKRKYMITDDFLPKSLTALGTVDHIFVFRYLRLGHLSKKQVIVPKGLRGLVNMPMSLLNLVDRNSYDSDYISQMTGFSGRESVCIYIYVHLYIKDAVTTSECRRTCYCDRWSLLTQLPASKRFDLPRMSFH